MQSLILDPASQTKFSGVTEMTDVRDQSGRLLGHFVPIEPPCPWEAELSEPEIRRRIEEPGASTLEEFWRKRGGE